MNLFEEAQILIEFDGKVGEAKKATYKWSLPERTLNAIISKINIKYSVWKNWLFWVEDRRTRRWWLYVKPGTDLSAMEKRIIDYIDQLIGFY